MAAELPAPFDCLLSNGFGGVHYDVNPMRFRCKPPGIQKLTSMALFLFDALCTFMVPIKKNTQWHVKVGISQSAIRS